MGQAEIMTHLMGNGGGEANWVFVVILGGEMKNYQSWQKVRQVKGTLIKPC